MGRLGGDVVQQVLTWIPANSGLLPIADLHALVSVHEAAWDVLSTGVANKCTKHGPALSHLCLVRERIKTVSFCHLA
jgi:hypothetical protein